MFELIKSTNEKGKPVHEYKPKTGDTFFCKEANRTLIIVIGDYNKEVCINLYNNGEQIVHVQEGGFSQMPVLPCKLKIEILPNA